MRFSTPAGVLAVVLASMGTAADAYTLKQAAQPAERPPAGYTKDVYVDSRGCAYVRANIGTAVNWVPRLSGDRKTVICNMTPSAAVATTSAPPPAPPAPPPATAVASPALAAAPVAPAPAPAAPALAPMPVAAAAPVATTMPTATAMRTMQVTCPADGSSARVRIGADTVRVSCPAGMATPASYTVRHADGSRTRLIAHPAPVALRMADAALPATPVVPGGRVIIGGLPPGEPNLDFGNGYGITTGYPPMDPVPHATFDNPAVGKPVNGTYPLPADAGKNYVPSGYRPAWDDDRLNPYRGPRTTYGDAQMATVLDTTTVPMKPAKPVAVTSGRTVVLTKGQPQAVTRVAPVATGARYVQVGAFGQAGNAQNALARIRSLGLGGATQRTGSGLTLVMAGPFASAAELQRALATLRGYYPDAYPRG